MNFDNMARFTELSFNINCEQARELSEAKDKKKYLSEEDGIVSNSIIYVALNKKVSVLRKELFVGDLGNRNLKAKQLC